MQLPTFNIPPKYRMHVRGVYSAVLLVLIVISAATVFVLKTKEFAFESILHPDGKIGRSAEYAPEPFPVGVNPSGKTIVEHADVDTYFERHFSSKPAQHEGRISFIDRMIAKLARSEWYQNLASPMSRVLVILPGERKEEVVDNFGDILRWNTTERKTFASHIETDPPILSEGKFFPGKYIVHKDATPADVSGRVIDRFTTEVLGRYTDSVEAVVPLEDALIIASLLEREAYDFADMRNVAGVIWNRLFIDMNLQIDATLQYAKGTVSRYAWWPRVYPKDKFIDSPFNTYEHGGLPPAPIGNPSVEAILATLNPARTDCMYYFHDANAVFHCAETYEEHVTLLKQYYGRGR